MLESASATEGHATEPAKGLLGAWQRLPLYTRIIIGLILGVIVGLVFGEKAEGLALPSRLILRLLGALAPPLILVAVIHVLMHSELKGRVAGRMVGLLLLNTVVAILVGLLVANVVRPGQWANLKPQPDKPLIAISPDPLAPRVLKILKDQGVKVDPDQSKDPFTQFIENVPRSLFGPLTDNGSVIGVIFIAVAFGVALRRVREREVRTIGDWVEVAFDTLLVVLHWIIELVPFGVFGIVASIIGKEGFGPFKALGAFVVAVLLALLLQAVYYLTRIAFGSWVRPAQLLRGTRDALVMAFSTASSTITMPVTFARLRDRVGLREESASMGALVGSNFNNDGTALYEAMSALFISQMLVAQGIMQPLGLPQQLMVVLTSIVASIGAAGIPEAGLVTMTLVFKAVGLPTEYIALLLTVDWFLDRCRTVINVMGDMNISCLLDGKQPKERQPLEQLQQAPAGSA